MKELLKIGRHVGKVYIRGFAVFFSICNIGDIYNKKDIREEIHGKLVLSAAWPVTVPIIMFGHWKENEKPIKYGIQFLWLLLLIAP